MNEKNKQQISELINLIEDALWFPGKTPNYPSKKYSTSPPLLSSPPQAHALGLFDIYKLAL